MAPHSEKLKLMRVVVREDFSRGRCDSLISDIRAAVLTCRKMDPADLKWHAGHVKDTVRAKGPSSHDHYQDEQHSLQGKFDKTHPIC